MKPSTGSSIRVSPAARKRIATSVGHLQVKNQQEVSGRALDHLEHYLFWQGFDDEAKKYLAQYPQEKEERRRFSATASDRLHRRSAPASA
jgi:hypothetical protein